MEKTGVSYLDYYIPNNKITAEYFIENLKDTEIPKMFEDKDSFSFFIEDILELEAITVENQLSDKEMISGLINKMFETDNIDPLDIDAIIFAQEPDRVQSKNIGQWVQHEFKMRNASIINISGNHCANIEHALKFATDVLNANNDTENILIITANKIEQLKDRLVGAYAVLGDSAGIMMVSKNDVKIRLKEYNSVHNGSFYEPNMDEDNSLILCKYYIECISGLLENTSKEIIDNIIVQNANTLLIEQCFNNLGIDSSIMYLENKGKYGHLDCIDFIMNLQDLTKNQSGNKPINILTFGTGWAGSFVATHLECI